MKARGVLVLSFAIVLATGFTGAADRAPIPQIKPAVEPRALPAGPTIISQVRLVHMVPGVAFIELTGRNFGVEKDHRLIMDGTPVQPILTWSEKSIAFEKQEPVDRTPQSHEFVIMNAAGQAVSNRYRAEFLVTWDRANPSVGAPESEVTLLCWGAGIQQGGRMIFLGNTPMEILSWQHDGRGQNQIRVRIPKVAPGSYQIMMHDGGDKISQPGGFMVR